jgi:hypothetical protein
MEIDARRVLEEVGELTERFEKKAVVYEIRDLRAS